MTRQPTVSSVMLARAQSSHDNALEDLLAEIDTAMVMRGMSEPSVYYGEWCPKCRKDCIPMPSGECGWCGTEVVDPA